ncbi:hypothetical protein QWY93_07310 [Echinicola jeungdonensis]|uniref:DoxX family membrane protein n=1 Tax=Echinicola jeungdonensis TaxID=709343 RepID=A0ABV5J9B0_9BACT|nr:hypothetical protein [Echinicola jeungdonensis]MDN3669132.1 hypothetical protein [Echinicola jeungdonensis]
MKPFFVLLSIFLLLIFFQWLRNKRVNWALAGRIAISGMLAFTSMGHFMFTEGMAKMIPEPVPMKIPIIWMTGILELAAAIGLHLKNWRKTTSWLLILFFILILPANINAAMENLNFQSGANDGPGTVYLWFRIPFQLLLIFWVYFFSLRPEIDKKKLPVKTD